MALTLIRTPKDDLVVNLSFATLVVQDGDTQLLICTISTTDDKVQPILELTKYEVLQPEDQFHTELREAAADKGQLVTSLSTNPEWNPKGYSKSLKDFENDTQ